jgi:hypothetical protein
MQDDGDATVVPLLPSSLRCCVTGCRRATTNLFCDLHRERLARLTDDEDDDESPEPPRTP